MSELDIYRSQGFGNSSGFGARPALLVVDFVNGFNDETRFVAGCTTSGCVRDRASAPHDANLFDMGRKYADLMTCEEVIARLTRPASAA